MKSIFLISINSLHFIFVSIFLMNSIDGSNWRCDYTYVLRAKGYFKYHEIPANWSRAEQRCELEGAVLASPYPQDVNETLIDLMSDKKRPIFTGIHSTFSPGDYYTINGIPLARIPITWMDSEPDNKNGEENCLIMTPQGLAADTKCSDTHPYFCYKEKQDDDVFLQNCCSSDRAYEYSAETRSCYKFHTTPRTWSSAFMTCSAEGGHLAIINSDAEAEVIKHIFARHPASSIIGTTYTDTALMGFYKRKEGGDWKTIHGETLQSAGYSRFSAGQPNNLDPGQYCGAISRSAKLDDIWCDMHLLFICEKKTNSLMCDEEEN